MKMRLRQIALVANELEPVERQIEEKLGVELCYRDSGVGHFGLHNALYPIGDKLLEVVAPTQEGTTAGRLLDKRGGDGGYMVILQVDELDPLRKRFEDHGVRVVYTAEGKTAVGLHLHPRDVGGTLLSTDRSDVWEEWPWAGESWQDHIKTDVVSDIVGVAIQGDDPAAMAKRWGDILGREVTKDGDEPRIELDQGVIRFIPITDGRGEGLAAIDVRATDGNARTEVVCGTDINFVP